MDDVEDEVLARWLVALAAARDVDVEDIASFEHVNTATGTLRRVAVKEVQWFFAGENLQRDMARRAKLREICEGFEAKDPDVFANALRQEAVA